MDTTDLGWRSAAAACLAVLVVSACGHGASSSATPGAASPAPAAARSAAPDGAGDGAGDSAPLPDANDQACAGVAAIIAHIKVDAARWSPTVRPFDQDVATRLESQTRYLNHQALAADLPIRRAVSATATSFDEVAGAITARNRARLDRAIVHSRTAYSALKKVCKFQE